MASTKTRKNKTHRKSPESSATAHPEGTIEYASNDERWVVTKTVKGVQRWTPYYSTTLFGYAPLTAKILAKNINKPIMVYEKQSGLMWPKSAKDFDVKYLFTASGDAELMKKGEVIKEFPNWLKKKTPAVKHNDIFIIKGTVNSKDLEATIQVAPLPGELVSTNLMNTDAFIKI